MNGNLGSEDRDASGPGGLTPTLSPQNSPNAVNDIPGKIEVKTITSWHVVVVETAQNLMLTSVQFITISGVLGAGLYTDSGVLLKYAGPGAVVTCYALLGFLTICVMQCIGEMVCIWPLPNALVRFVRDFVDPELGTVVGLCYWFAWTVSFQALIYAAALEGATWFGSPESPSFGQIVALYIAPQLVFLVINALPVKLYGFLELLGGAIKVILICVVIVLMGIINHGFGAVHRIGQKNFTPAFRHPVNIRNETTAVLMAIARCAYSFLGAEIPAVTATEATLNVKRKSHLANRAIFFSVAYLPAITTVVYLIAGILVAFDLEQRNYSQLSGPTWLNSRSDPPISPSTAGFSNSSATAFGLVAQETQEKWLGTMFTGFFVFTAWSAANTSLYLSSRTLYGLTAGLVEQPGSLHSDRKSKLTRCFGWMAHTSHPAKVPFYAALFNFVISFWIPYLPIWVPGDKIAASTVLEILQLLAAVCGVLVWACECWAYINFKKYSLKHHENLRKESHLTYLIRSRNFRESHYPWRSIGQPFTAYFALFGCCVVVVASGSPAWNSASWRSIPSSDSAIVAIIGGYGPLVIMTLFWILLKWLKYGRSFRDWCPFIVRYWNTGYYPIVNALDTERNQAIADFQRKSGRVE